MRNQVLLAPAVVLLRGWHQGCIDDLAVAGDEALLGLLRRDAIEQGLGPGVADPVPAGPDRGAIGVFVALSNPQRRL